MCQQVCRDLDNGLGKGWDNLKGSGTSQDSGDRPTCMYMQIHAEHNLNMHIHAQHSPHMHMHAQHDPGMHMHVACMGTTCMGHAYLLHCASAASLLFKQAIFHNKQIFNRSH